jgi:hypothetical protein
MHLYLLCFRGISTNTSLDSFHQFVYKQLMGQYTHCELAFSDNNSLWSQQTVKAFSITYDSQKAFLIDKEFSRNDYDWIEIGLSQNHIREIYKWCKEKTKTAIFNQRLTLNAVIPFESLFDCFFVKKDKYFCNTLFNSIFNCIIGSKKENEYFCSMLCIEALQSQNYLLNIPSKFVTPSYLFYLVKKHLKGKKRKRVTQKKTALSKISKKFVKHGTNI